MNCDFTNHDPPDAEGKFLRRCIRCGYTTKRRVGAETPVRAECQAWPFAHEVGHWIAILLAAAGITKGRWNWLQAMLGRPPCRCGERQEAANSWGARAARWLASRGRPQ
jgi:hypothetical protein